MRTKKSLKNNDEHKTECPECPTEANIYWDKRYNGKRGTCPVCGTNWAES